jgi:hypothetical protein
MAQHWLEIIVGDEDTTVQYVTENKVLVSHTHPVGYRIIEADGMNAIARSKFLDGVLYMLEFISLNDRIPTEFKVISPQKSACRTRVIGRSNNIFCRKKISMVSSTIFWFS